MKSVSEFASGNGDSSVDFAVFLARYRRADSKIAVLRQRLISANNERQICLLTQQLVDAQETRRALENAYYGKDEDGSKHRAVWAALAELDKVERSAKQAAAPSQAAAPLPDYGATRQFLDDLQQRGVQVTVNDGQLRVQAKSGVLTTGLRMLIAEQRQELLHLLSQGR